MISIMYKTFIFLTLLIRKKAYQLRGLYSKQMQYVSAGIFQKINMHWLITVHFLQTRRLLTMLLWIFIKHHLFFVTARIRILCLADLRRNLKLNIVHVIVFILSTTKIKQPVVMFCYTGISLSSQQQKQQGAFFYQIATDKEIFILMMTYSRKVL